MKIKKTLFISSFILAIVLVVTIVSVSAAWFGDTLSISNEIDIKTALPTGEIMIKTGSVSYDGDTTLIPAIMNKGYLLTSDINPSTINVLDDNLIDTTEPYTKPLHSKAHTVKIYFPIYGVGTTSRQDGKLPSIIQIDGVYSSVDTEKASQVNYIDDFIINLKVVDGTTHQVIESSGNDEMTMNDGKVCWGYSSSLHKIGLFVDQGPDIYIELSISFSKVDEELPPELMDTMIRVSLTVPQGPSEESVINIINTAKSEV